MNKQKNKRGRSYNDLKRTSPLPSLEFDLLFSHVSKKDRAYFLVQPEMTLCEKKYITLINLEKKRLKNWPLPYLLKSQGFFNISLEVSPSVLIPRPETEILVETIINKINLSNKKESTNIIDLGCGSGAIIISLAKNLGKIRKLNFFASDISLAALKIAKKNTLRYKLNKKINFKNGDLLIPWENKLKSFLEKKEKVIITANLPYLNQREMKEDCLEKEPRLALLSGKDGLNHYRKLFSQLSIFNKKNKQLIEKNIFLICEINPHQVKNFSQIVKRKFPSSKIELKKDLRHKNRFVLIQF